MTKGSDHIIKSLKRSRKAFFVEYGCATILVLLLIVLAISGIIIPKTLTLTVLAIVVLIILSVEFSRYMVRYLFTPKKFVMVHGIIRQRKRNVYYLPLGFVPDIDTHQSRIQRVLGIGSVSISGQPAIGGQEAETFQIKDVSDPHGVLEFLEEMIAKSMNTKTKTPLLHKGED